MKIGEIPLLSVISVCGNYILNEIAQKQGRRKHLESKKKSKPQSDYKFIPVKHLPFFLVDIGTSGENNPLVLS